MTKTWPDANQTSSDLDRDLDKEFDQELASIFEQVEETLGQEEEEPWPDDGWSLPPEIGAAAELDLSPLTAIAPADIMAEEVFPAEELDIAVAPASTGPFPDSVADGGGWLEPGLLGEPEAPAGSLILTPEAVRELSQIIEAAVEKGVAAALAKMRR